LALGCQGKKAQEQVLEAAEEGGAGSPSERRIAAGDSVVVENEESSFWSARVVRVDGSKIVYEYGSGQSKGETEQDKVYAVGAGSASVAGEGEFAICQTGPGAWNGCMIKRVNGGAYVAEDFWGKSYNLTVSQVIVPRSEARGRIESKHREASKPREFLKAASGAGDPWRPEGWSPRPGEDIVAKFTDASWYGGRIRRVTPTKVHIAWDDRMPPSERDYGDVAPRPSKPIAVREGQYVIGRPRKGAKWDYFLVESVDDKGVVLVNKDGEKKKVKQRDVIPLGT
ncbi:MAG: hypothetical protein U1E22_09730, partial [Coriobacteriia bacterium]|nr:hypothetical protein [Coriobacteriia bacterium]